MYNWQWMVKNFHEKFDCTRHNIPTKPNTETILLRGKLHREEQQELSDAMIDGDLPAIAKEIADLIYVALGTAVACGIEMREIFEEVHRSNMTKTPGNKRGDGKILKGKDYIPPNLDQIIKAQTDGSIEHYRNMMDL